MCEHNSSGRFSATILSLKLLSQYSLLVTLLQTISYEGLDPHVPPHSIPHPTATRFSEYVPLGWRRLHSHTDEGRRNPFAVVCTHSHHHNTAALSHPLGARLCPPHPLGLKKRKPFRKISTQGHVPSYWYWSGCEESQKGGSADHRMKDTCKTAKNKSKQYRFLATVRLLVNITGQK